MEYPRQMSVGNIVSIGVTVLGFLLTVATMAWVHGGEQATLIGAQKAAEDRAAARASAIEDKIASVDQRITERYASLDSRVTKLETVHAADTAEVNQRRVDYTQAMQKLTDQVQAMGAQVDALRATIERMSSSTRTHSDAGPLAAPRQFEGTLQ